MGYLRPHAVALIGAVLMAVASVAFNVVGPDILGQVVTKLFEGLTAKVQGTGGIDFDGIAASC